MRVHEGTESETGAYALLAHVYRVSTSAGVTAGRVPSARPVRVQAVHEERECGDEEERLVIGHPGR